jgi:tripartite-type tricarboxylate transporter receptor subunit TctC
MTQDKPQIPKTLMRIIVVVLILVTSPLGAQPPKNFFEGKTITLFAGSSPGGGTDQTVRLIARHLERYIPGKPSILVVNKPGAGGLIAVNDLYNLRKPDGLTMSNINTGAIFAVAGGDDAIKFDLQKFIYIGQALDEAQTVYVRAATPYMSLDLIKKANKEGKQPRMGAQSLDHTSNFVVKVVEQILGLDFRVIPGYPGTPEILLDIERGALDGRAQGTGSLMATKREWLKSGYIKPLVTSRKTRDSRVPGVPSIAELAPVGSKGLLGALAAAQNIGRSIALPPGVAPDRVKELRDAFAAMTKDEQFLKEADKLGLEVGLIRGEDLNRDIETTLRDKRMMDLYRMIASAK